MDHIPFNSGHRYFLAESSGLGYTRAGDYTQNSFIYSWWDLGIAQLQQFLLFLYAPLLKCHFWSWIGKWLAWKSWSAWFPKYIFKILRVYNCWKCSFCKTQVALFCQSPLLRAAPSSHNEETIFYNVHYEIRNGLNYLTLQGLPFLWNILPN